MLQETPTSVLAPGTLINDRLTVVRRVGVGGLGEVYEVEHKYTRHRRAVKVLHPQFRKDADVVERFLREASAAGRIGNPHIVETFDAGHLSDGSPFIVMEFLVGSSLAAVLRQSGPLDVGRATALMVQVCTAVQAAHDANIIHRDLKPENLFVIERDRRAFIKVLDFGISRFQVGGDAGEELSKTRSGVTMGTPYYMAPEQLRAAKNADARSDVYSLGTILYEMLSGRLPYVAESFAELAVRILNGEHEPLSALVAGVPGPLSDMVSKAIHKNPAERFLTAQALGAALEAFTHTAVLEYGALTVDRTKVIALEKTATPETWAQDTATPSELPPNPTVAEAPAAVTRHLQEALQPAEVLPLKGRSMVPFATAAFIGILVGGAAVVLPRLQAPVAVLPAQPRARPTVVSPPVAVVAPSPAPEPLVPAKPEPVPPVAEKPELRVAPAPVQRRPISKPAVIATPSPPVPKPLVETELPKTGTVDVGCLPVACAVTIDGEYVGETPLLNQTLAEGSHIAVFVNIETRSSQTRTFVVTPSARAKVVVRF